MTDSLTIVPPHDLDGEKVVLGSIFLEPDLLLEIAEVIVPADFYSGNHGAIFKAMLELSQRREPIDVLLVKRMLGKETFERIGGDRYLADIAHYVPTAFHAVAHAQAVLDCSRRRAMLETLRRLEADLIDSAPGSAAEVADHVASAVLRVTQERVPSPTKSIGETMPLDFAQIQEMRRTGQPIGVTTGLIALDDAIGGIESRIMTVIAGRPGTGNTAVACNLLHRIAARTELPVVFFSAEMSGSEINHRLMAAASVNLWKMRRGRIFDSEEERLERAVTELSKLSFFVDDTPAISLAQMRSRVRQI